MSDDGNAMRYWFASLLRSQSNSLKLDWLHWKSLMEQKKQSKLVQKQVHCFSFFSPILKMSVNIFKERFAKREGTKSCVEWAESGLWCTWRQNKDGDGVAVQLCLSTACGLGTCGIHLQTWEGSCIQTVGTRCRFPGRWRKVPAAPHCGQEPICMWGPLNLFTGHWVPGFLLMRLDTDGKSSSSSKKTTELTRKADPKEHTILWKTA